MHDDLNQLPTKIPTPRDQWLDDFRRGPMTIIVWGIAVLLSAWLLTQRHSAGDLLGMANGSASDIRALNNGVLEEVLVDLYQTVEAGQILALLDSAEFDARLATSRAKLESLQTGLQAAEIRLASEAVRGDRGWNADWREETRLRVEVLAFEVKLAEDRVEEQRLALQIVRQRSLRDSGIVSAADLEDLELRHRQIQQRIQENEKALAATGDALQVATLEREKLLDSRPQNASADSLELEALRLDAQAAHFQLQELELARRGLVLKAPISGQVQAILAQSGQNVLSGEPVLRLASLRADQVIVYLPEIGAYDVADHSRVLVAPQNAPQRTFETSIGRTSPTIEMLPRRLWRSVNVPEYGRSALLAPIPELQLIPGQLVTARLAK